MRYKIAETFNGSSSTFSPALKNSYNVFQFHNDSVNTITLTITPLNPNIDDIIIKLRSEEKFNSGDVITEVPEFNSISIDQETDGNYRLYLISKE